MPRPDMAGHFEIRGITCYEMQNITRVQRADARADTAAEDDACTG